MSDWTSESEADIAVERLRDLLCYDPLTGIFVWRVDRGRVRAGDIAGSRNKNGYVYICLDGVQYLAHRLAWRFVYGIWPPADLDHEDTCRDHNWIKNLRPATRSENNQNQRRPSRRNKSGFLGVSLEAYTGRYKATITINKHQVRLGRFDTAEQAHAAYLAAKAVFHPRSTL